MVTRDCVDEVRSYEVNTKKRVIKSLVAFLGIEYLLHGFFLAERSDGVEPYDKLRRHKMFLVNPTR